MRDGIRLTNNEDREVQASWLLRAERMRGWVYLIPSLEFGKVTRNHAEESYDARLARGCMVEAVAKQ